MSERTKAAFRAPPRAFVHGFTGGADAAAVLELDLECRFTLTGHGLNPDLSSLSFQDEVERLARKLRELAEPCHLIAYSMGARVALAACLRHPESIAAATLIGVNAGAQSTSQRKDRLLWEGEWIRALEEEGLASFVEKWSQLPLFSSQSSLSSAQQQAQSSLRLSHQADGLAHALGVLGLGHMPDLSQELDELRIPLQLVVGSLDQKFVDIALTLQKMNSRISVKSIEGCGHNLLLEAPRQLKEMILQYEANVVSGRA